MQAWLGTVEGSGEWLESDRVLSATLVFIAEEQTSRWEERYTALRTEEHATRFLFDFEESDYVMPLIANEMVPRHEHWQGKLLEWLPAVAGSVVRATPLPEGAGIVVDGVVSEPHWQYPEGFPGTGHAQGWPRGAHGELHARAGDEGLYLLMRAAETPVQGSTLWVGLAPGFAVPARNSPRFAMTRNAEGLKGTRYADGHTPGAWAPQWQVAETAEEGQWCCEVFIPYRSLGLEAAPPAGSLWRLNVHRCADAGEAPQAPILVWGAPDFDDVLHGVLVAFGDETG
jgi:hypothetical protein